MGNLTELLLDTVRQIADLVLPSGAENVSAALSEQFNLHTWDLIEKLRGNNISPAAKLSIC